MLLEGREKRHSGLCRAACRNLSDPDGRRIQSHFGGEKLPCSRAA